MNTRIELPASRVTRTLSYGLAFLLLMHLIGVFCHLVLHVRAEAFVQLFDVDLEANLPTFYNCFLFFVGAALFMVSGRLEDKKYRSGWTVMAGVFVFLGVDEGSQIHEKFMLFTLRLMNHGQQTGTHLGWWYYAWVIPYGIASIALVFMLSRWLISLDNKLRTGLIISGVVYVFGAVFMEMYSGKIAEGLEAATLTADQMRYIPCEIYESGTCQQYVDPGYIAAYTVEETCEMVGLIICAHVLMKALSRKRASIEIVLEPKD